MRYPVVLADPPWPYEVYSRDTGAGRSAEAHYSTMTIAEIMALPIPDVLAKDACLFLWATWPTLKFAFMAAEAWGLTYKTDAFLWVKTRQKAMERRVEDPSVWFTGMGFWTRANTEPCLLFTQGHPKRKAKDVRQLVVAPFTRHSAKPPIVHSRIERLVEGPYLELFARERHEGWQVEGNEIDGLDIREALSRLIAEKDFEPCATTLPKITKLTTPAVEQIKLFTLD